MKRLLIVVVASATCGLCTSGLAGHAIFKGDTWVGTYKFDVPTGEKDRWDSASQDTPPLAPGKAIRIAETFVQKVPLPKGWVRWEIAVGGVALYRLSSSGPREEWVYLIHFLAVWQGPQTASAPYPEIYVPVRMDGTIPEPTIEKGKS